MHLTLLESERAWFHSAEWACVSIVAHVGVIWYALTATAGGRHLPVDEREARVFFLLPPDRVKAEARQLDVADWKRLGRDLANGPPAMGPAEGLGVRARASGSSLGKRNGRKGDLPFGPTPFVPDSVYSVLQVDQMVERYEGSAAPVYPDELRDKGVEGMVQATYVVDTAGRVDTTTIHVSQSNDPRFTQSVVAALGEMRFRPARRSGKTVRQLVEQRFRFKLASPPKTVQRSS
jgi:TonB family protein